MKYVAAFALLAISSPIFTLAQTNPASIAADHWRKGYERQIVDEFTTLLSVPDVSNDRTNIQRNAELIAAMMRKRGIESRLISVPGANPVVFGEIRTPGAKRTVVLYAHYDGQPVDPRQWATPLFRRRCGMDRVKAAAA